MKKPRTRVSDHALLRYMERVQGVDLERMHRRIGKLVETGIEEGADGVVIGGFSYKLKGKTVTTVIPARQPDVRTGRVRDKRRSRDD